MDEKEKSEIAKEIIDNIVGFVCPICGENINIDIFIEDRVLHFHTEDNNILINKNESPTTFIETEIVCSNDTYHICSPEFIPLKKRILEKLKSNINNLIDINITNTDIILYDEKSHE